MDYNDQYLMISAKIANESIPISKISEKTVESIELDKFNEYPDKLSKWKAFIQKEYQKGHSIVLWGGGSKAVAFLTTLHIKEEIKMIVDINTRKNNTFIAGTGQKIVTPEYLPKIQPEWIIVMNPIYKLEVETELKKMNLGCTVITIQYI
jgi:hypothetical protein